MIELSIGTAVVIICAVAAVSFLFGVVCVVEV